MNIYFACSITGGREDEVFYQAIVGYLVDQSHDVPTAHLAGPEVMALEAVVDPFEVYARDVAWIKGCDALVAEVSTPSHGVGYEIGLALSLAKPVLCCYRLGIPVSKMILGNPDPRLSVSPYTSKSEAIRLVEDFLTDLEAR
jgi:hypothetical protein